MGGHTLPGDSPPARHHKHRPRGQKSKKDTAVKPEASAPRELKLIVDLMKGFRAGLVEFSAKASIMIACFEAELAKKNAGQQTAPAQPAEPAQANKNGGAKHRRRRKRGKGKPVAAANPEPVPPGDLVTGPVEFPSHNPSHAVSRTVVANTAANRVKKAMAVADPETVSSADLSLGQLANIMDKVLTNKPGDHNPNADGQG